MEIREWRTGVCFERAFYANYSGIVQSSKTLDSRVGERGWNDEVVARV